MKGGRTAEAAQARDVSLTFQAMVEMLVADDGLPLEAVLDGTIMDALAMVAAFSGGDVAVRVCEKAIANILALPQDQLEQRARAHAGWRT